METARQRPWEVYGKELAEAVAGFLNRKSKVCRSKVKSLKSKVESPK
jgi:hypothetical protein